jgi:hypothetical protein
MAFLRIILMIVGAFFFVSGSFFTLQGLGIIMWPSDSFMLAEPKWVLYGALIAAAGALAVVLARRLGR